MWIFYKIMKTFAYLMAHELYLEARYLEENWHFIWCPTPVLYFFSYRSTHINGVGDTIMPPEWAALSRKLRVKAKHCAIEGIQSRGSFKD